MLNEIILDEDLSMAEKKQDNKLLVKNIFEVPVPAMNKIVKDRCNPIKTTDEFTTRQLIAHLSKNYPFENIEDKRKDIENDINYWRGSGILNPIKEPGTASYHYNYDQIFRATQAAYLKWDCLVADAAIAGFLVQWNSREETAHVNVDIAEIERARMLPIARCLGVITCLITELSSPPGGAILILHPLTEDEERSLGEKDCFTHTSLPGFDVDPDRDVIASTTNQPEAEALVRIRNFHEYIRKMSDARFHCVRIKDSESLDRPYLLVIGLTENPTDDHARKIILQVGLGSLPTSALRKSSNWDLVCKLIKYIFSVLLKLPEFVSGHDRRYCLIDQSDLLEVLITSILPMNPLWRSCAFWAKVDEENLHIRTASPDYPGDRKLRLRLDETDNLVSFVFKQNESMLLWDAQVEDPRFPNKASSFPHEPFALIPAVSTNGVEGVLYIGASFMENYQIAEIKKSDTDFLRILAGLVAEAYLRQQVSDVSHLVKGADEVEVKTSQASLEDALGNILKDKIVPGLDKGVDISANEYMAIFILLLKSTHKHDIQAWYDEIFGRRMLALLKQQQIIPRSYASSDNIDFFHPDFGTVIALVKSVTMTDVDYFEDIRNNLRTEIRKKGKGFDSSVEVYLWSFHFSYAYLHDQLTKPLEMPHELDIKNLVRELIINRYHDSLPRVRDLSLAEECMREHHYQEAISLLKSSRPDTFIFRRLSDAYAALKRWDDALEAAKSAAKDIYPYAGSYTRLAKAYVGLEKFDDALQAYKRATEISPAEVRYQLEYAEALTLYGTNTEEYQTAAKILSELANTPIYPSTTKAWIYTLHSRVITKLQGKLQNAKDDIELAMDKDHSNPFINWEARLLDRGKGLLT